MTTRCNSNIVLVFLLVLTFSLSVNAQTTTLQQENVEDVRPGYNLVRRVTIVPNSNSTTATVVVLLDNGRSFQIKKKKLNYTYTPDEAFSLRSGDQVRLKKSNLDGCMDLEAVIYVKTSDY